MGWPIVVSIAALRIARQRGRQIMSVQIRMPALSSTHDEGKLAKWLVKEGQRVRTGDIIAEVETDEAVIEIEAVEEGSIAKLLVAEGTAAVKVNSPIAILEQGAGGSARPAGSNPGPRLASDGQRISQPITPPTAVVRTRFKSTLTPAGGNSGTSRPAPAAAAPATAASPNPVGAAKTTFVRAAVDTQTDPVAGWLVVVKGPGRGGFRPIYVGMNSIGRDPGQRVSLSFGDEAISREEHAFVTYDEESRRFYIQHGGKANLIRIGAQPVLVPTELKTNDRIRIGKTTLRFVPCCGPEFTWGDEA